MAASDPLEPAGSLPDRRRASARGAVRCSTGCSASGCSAGAALRSSAGSCAARSPGERRARRRSGLPRPPADRRRHRPPAVQGALRINGELGQLGRGARAGADAGAGPAARAGRRPDAVGRDQLGRPRESGSPPAEVGLADGCPPSATCWLRRRRCRAVVVAAVVHGELLALSPFGSGNGLVARAAARLVLIHRGARPQGADRARRRPRRLIRRPTPPRPRASRPGDLGRWLVHCARGPHGRRPGGPGHLRGPRARGRPDRLLIGAPAGGPKRRHSRATARLPSVLLLVEAVGRLARLLTSTCLPRLVARGCSSGLVTGSVGRGTRSTASATRTRSSTPRWRPGEKPSSWLRLDGRK